MDKNVPSHNFGTRDFLRCSQYLTHPRCTQTMLCLNFMIISQRVLELSCSQTDRHESDRQTDRHE